MQIASPVARKAANPAGLPGRDRGEEAADVGRALGGLALSVPGWQAWARVGNLELPHS